MNMKIWLFVENAWSICVESGFYCNRCRNSRRKKKTIWWKIMVDSSSEKHAFPIFRGSEMKAANQVKCIGWLRIHSACNTIPSVRFVFGIIVLQFIVCDVVIICVEKTLAFYWKVCRRWLPVKCYCRRSSIIMLTNKMFCAWPQTMSADWAARQYHRAELLFFFCVLLFSLCFSVSLAKASHSRDRCVRLTKEPVAKNDFRQVVVASNRTKLGNDTGEYVLAILRKWVERSKCWVLFCVCVCCLFAGISVSVGSIQFLAICQSICNTFYIE